MQRLKNSSAALELLRG